MIPDSEPAPTITAAGLSTGRDVWVHERPATTIVGSYNPDIVAAPGFPKAGDPSRQNTPGSVRVSLKEAAILQSFRADYPFQGSRTSKFTQVGNAVPPLLARAVIQALVATKDTP